MTKLTLATRVARPANKSQYYIPKGRANKVRLELGTHYAPVSISKKHEQALDWIADNAVQLIADQDIDPMRAILSYAAQAEGKLGFVWRIGPSEWQRIAASGVDGVRAKARDTKYLKSLED